MNDLINFPKVPSSLDSIVKPEELVDIVEMTPLTLQDRRIYNLLLGNAWNHIFAQTEHVIQRNELTKYVESNNQDIEASLRRLMSAIVVVKIRNNSNGRPSTRQMPLLGENDIEDRGPIKYTFPPALIKIIKNTQIFARLHTQVMFQLSSKYSLTLYEFLQRRKNLRHINSEVLPVEEVRGLLGVGKDKLKSFGHLNNKAIKPAVREVSFLTEYEIDAAPVRTGRTVTHIRFAWHKKQDIGAQISAVEELERSKVGRNARMKGEVEQLTSIGSVSQKSDFKNVGTASHEAQPSPGLENISTRLSESALERGRAITREAGTGWDFNYLIQAFETYAQSKGCPANIDGAFIGFVKKKVKQPAA